MSEHVECFKKVLCCWWSLPFGCCELCSLSSKGTMCKVGVWGLAVPGHGGSLVPSSCSEWPKGLSMWGSRCVWGLPLDMCVSGCFGIYSKWGLDCKLLCVSLNLSEWVCVCGWAVKGVLPLSIEKRGCWWCLGHRWCAVIDWNKLSVVFSSVFFSLCSNGMATFCLIYLRSPELVHCRYLKFSWGSWILLHENRVFWYSVLGVWWPASQTVIGNTWSSHSFRKGEGNAI